VRFYVPESPYRRFINVQNWQLELAKEFSPNYIRIVQGMLSIAFDRAIVLGIAKKNPSRMVGNIKSKKTKVDFWTLEEFQKVTSLLYKGDYYEHYLFISFWLLFMTGMRIGEAAALQWSDIDFETGLSNINKTLYYKSMDEYKFVDPKTQASVRTIYIDADTIRELKAWREVQQKVLKGCGFILSYSGIPTSKHTLPRALEKLAGLAGVHRIKIHSLRHSHTSLLISMGENPLLIKERLGHEKIQTTLGTYGHLYPNTNLEVANKLTGVLHYTPATQSVADYTSNQFTASYHRELE
jgi:integrase